MPSLPYELRSKIILIALEESRRYVYTYSSLITLSSEESRKDKEARSRFELNHPPFLLSFLFQSHPAISSHHQPPSTLNPSAVRYTPSSISSQPCEPKLQKYRRRTTVSERISGVVLEMVEDLEGVVVHHQSGVVEILCCWRV